MGKKTTRSYKHKDGHLTFMVCHRKHFNFDSNIKVKRWHFIDVWIKIMWYACFGGRLQHVQMDSVKKLPYC